MGKPLSTATVEYAYVRDLHFTPNVPVGEGFKHRITITFDLCDADKNHLDDAHRDYLSDAYEEMQSYAEYTAWRSANESGFIAAGKLELSGYGL